MLGIFTETILLVRVVSAFIPVKVPASVKSVANIVLRVLDVHFQLNTSLTKLQVKVKAHY